MLQMGHWVAIDFVGKLFMRKMRYELGIALIIAFMVIELGISFYRNYHSYFDNIVGQLKNNSLYSSEILDRNFLLVKSAVQHLGEEIVEGTSKQDINHLMANRLCYMGTINALYYYDFKEETISDTKMTYGMDTASIHKRPWYKLAMETSDIITTPIYADLYRKQPVFSIARRLSKDNHNLGIVAADIYLDDYYFDVYMEDSVRIGYQYIMDAHGTILMHPSDAIVGAQLDQIEAYRKIGVTQVELGDFKKRIHEAFEKNEGSITYRIRQTDMIGYYKKLDTIDGYVFTVISKDVVRGELQKYILNSAFFYLLTLSGIMALFVLLYRNSYYRDEETGVYNVKYANHFLTKLMKEPQDRLYGFMFIHIDQLKYYNSTAENEDPYMYYALVEYLKIHLREEQIIIRISKRKLLIILPDKEWTHIQANANVIHELLNNIFLYDEDRFDVKSTNQLVQIHPYDLHKHLITRLLNFNIYGNEARGNLTLHPEYSQIVSEIEAFQNKQAKIIQALKEDAIIPFFQPIYDLKGEKIDKYEVLMRIREGEGYLSPYDYILVAEETGLIHDIDNTMIEKALNYKVIHDSQSQEPLRLSINISSKNIDFTFMNNIIQKIELRHIKAQDITFEITETQSIDNINAVRELMGLIKKKGYKFSIDDFGTGFSNTSYLKSLDVDYIKIDGMFIRNIDSSLENYYIVKAYVDLAYALNVEIVAEFVETEAEMEILKALGIQYIQGYYIGKPVAEI